MDLLRISTVDDLRKAHKKWVEEILNTQNYIQEINSLNVSLPAPLNAFLYLTGAGSKNFVEGVKDKLGIRAKDRKVGESRGAYHLREAQAAYHSDFTPEKDGLKSKTPVFGTLILQFSFSACYPK